MRHPVFCLKYLQKYILTVVCVTNDLDFSFARVMHFAKIFKYRTMTIFYIFEEFMNGKPYLICFGPVYKSTFIKIKT